MRAGLLRHRVQIQSPSSSLDNAGQDILTWSTDATVWGSVEPLNGRELLEAQQVSPDVTHRVTIRFDGNITPQSRIIHKTRTLNIESVLRKDEREIEMQVLAREVI